MPWWTYYIVVDAYTISNPNNDNDTFNKYQTSDGVTHTFELGVNTSDEFKFRKNISNTRTDIFTIDHGTAVMTFDHTPKIGSNNILHATDNISEFVGKSIYWLSVIFNSYL